MGEEAALAHAELLGEGANGEAFEALRGSDIDGAGENGFAGAEAFGLAAEGGSVDGPLERLAGAFFPGTGAKGLNHENTVTQHTNKHERSFIVVCSCA